MTKPTVFISYSHKDEAWKDYLRPHLEILEKAGRITIWDDRDIDPGGKWFGKIKQIMDGAAVAICLISADYLASDFCAKEEIPYLLERREKEGLVIIPVLLRPCLWKAVPWLKEAQMLPRDGKSVSKDFKDNWDEVFFIVAKSVFTIVDKPDYRPPKPSPRWLPPEKVNIHHLPMTGVELFGRQKQLEMLDEAWDSDQTHIISLVAWGGVGKSTLVNKWLERMAADNYRGASRVYAWSFYSQGTDEKVTSADMFISEALAWFGDPDPKIGSPWDKGKRLADLIKNEKTLLVLDGLEPLQSPFEFDRGKIKDPGLATLVLEMARQNRGLCVITTRGAVADISPFPETVRQENLEHISAEAGRAILRISGVQGTDAELEAATRDFGYHAFALTLLGAYLHNIPNHSISYAFKIPNLDIPEDEGRHPRRLLAAFEEYFGEGQEVELLKLLSLFDRPIDDGAIAALRAFPPIMNLTDYINKLSEIDWLHLLQKLRNDKLIAPESRHQPNMIDSHPLVREHFRQRLRERWPKAWREGNNRLYEFYKYQSEVYPGTIEEMTKLYLAVYHGCEADRHQDAMDEVFWPRIRREYDAFNIKRLGAFGADLAVLSSFFSVPWKQTEPKLDDHAKTYVISEVSYDLQALGRLEDAIQPRLVALESRITLKDFVNACVSAHALSELYLTIGDIDNALQYAYQSIDLADRSKDALKQIGRLDTLAIVLHQAGRLSDAETVFQKIEEMKKEVIPNSSIFSSLAEFHYCDFLLSKGNYKKIIRRAKRLLKWASESQIPRDIANSHLILGRVYFLLAVKKRKNDFTKATEHINKALDGLRKAGSNDHIPRGLIARAELYRVRGEFVKSKQDLDEALSIVERGNMGLYRVDCNLEYARLYLAMKKKDDARKCLDLAREMIEKMGYHRQDKELKEIEEQLKNSATV